MLAVRQCRRVLASETHSANELPERLGCGYRTPNRMVRGHWVWVGFALSVVTACGNVANGTARTSLDVQQAAPQEPVVENEAVTPNPEDLPGLDPDVVVAVVNRHEGAVSGCHVIEEGDRATESGSVTLTWSIAPSGHVEDVSVSQSTFENASLHRCIVAVIAGLEFPTAPGSTEVGGWRFRFRSRDN